MKSSPTTAIIGAGSIGVAWAVVFVRAGYDVRVHDLDAEFRRAAPAAIHNRLQALSDAGLYADDVATAMSQVTVADSVGEAVHGATYVQESVVENVHVKRQLFAKLDAVTGADVVLASSSSMIPSSHFAGELPDRARCLVVHPANPPYLLPLAELVPAPFTAESVVRRAEELLRAAGMVPVVVKGEPEGFAFNRLQGALLREAYCLVRDGVLSPRDVDRVVSLGLGRRWSVVGPFGTADLNTRGGIERHAALMGPAYARMGAERGQDDPWPAELVAKVASDVHTRLPIEDWSRHVAQRDRALMTLERARRADPHAFDTFT